jgi:hypothetical protein
MSKTLTDTTTDDITWGDDFLQQECSCCLCGNDLTFEHDFNFSKQTVIEISSCPKCKIDLKTQEHKLH